jgi:hypothetical protein
MNAQIASGGAASGQGRAEQDPLLEQTFYVVPSEQQRPRLVSQSLIQDVVVLQVGNFPTSDKKGNTATTAEAAGAAPTPAATALPGAATTAVQAVTVVPPPDIITLIVTPQDAITLNYLLYADAKLTLALRSAGDDSKVETEAVTLQFLLEQYNIPVPAKLPYGVEPRVDDLVIPTLPNDIATPVPAK